MVNNEYNCRFDRKNFTRLSHQTGDDLSLFLTAPLDEHEEGPAYCSAISAATTSTSVPSSTAAAAAAAKTVNTAPSRLVTIRAAMNTISCRKKKSWPMPRPIRMPVPTASPSLPPAGPFRERTLKKALDTYRTMKGELHIGLCASHGLLTRAQLHALRQTGVTSYHHNIETSRRFFPQICTTHTYDDRIRTIKDAQAEGALRLFWAASSAWGKPGKTGWIWPSALPNSALNPFPSTP